jgi:SAM-dependent methyltransferase
MTARDWISFWDEKHSIYVNARHHAAHYRRIADDIRRYVPAGGAVLDYGCGEALSADRVAADASRLILCEAAPHVRAAITARFTGNAKIEVRTPEEVASLPAGSLDLIVMHSVAQYLTPGDLDRLLKTFRRLLKPHGTFVLGDVIPRKVFAITDALALLRFGAREGFFVAAVFGLVRTVFSSYWRLRGTLGLARYDQSEIVARLKAAGFAAARESANIGHNPARMTFLARPV